MKGMKALKSGFLCMAMVANSVMFAVPAHAAAIPTLIVNMKETRGQAGEVWDAEPVVQSMNCEIEDYDWAYDRGSWKPGKKVTVTVTVGADEDSNFTSNTNVVVINGEKSTANKSGSKYVVKINYIPKVQLAQPTGIYYEDETTLCWQEVEYAGGYEVQIKRDGQFYKTVPVSGKNNVECDLSEYVTDDYTYTCSVRATAPSGKMAYITASDWVDFDGQEVSMLPSTTAGNFLGTGAYKKFVDSNGTTVTGWQEINGTWYYFNPENYSYAVTGTVAEIGGYKYSFDENGHMLTGWKKEADGYWYLYNSDLNMQIPYGAARTGWVQSSPTSPWYFLNDGRIEGYPQGAMLVNGTTPDGFTVNENGEWIQ